AASPPESARVCLRGEHLLETPELPPDRARATQPRDAVASGGDSRRAPERAEHPARRGWLRARISRAAAGSSGAARGSSRRGAGVERARALSGARGGSVLVDGGGESHGPCIARGRRSSTAPDRTSV